VRPTACDISAEKSRAAQKYAFAHFRGLAHLPYNFSGEDGASMAKANRSNGTKRASAVKPQMGAQALNEFRAASAHIIILTPDQQLAFWKAINASPKLTASQRRLGAIMRGDT
jgi:hypothetical protein